MEILKQIPSTAYTFVILILITAVILILQNWKLKKEFQKLAIAKPELRRPICNEDRIEFEKWLDERALPYVGMVLTYEPPANSLSSHVGGSAAAPQETYWPLDKKSNPMLLLAQINFSELASLADFPDQGVLQFFIPNQSGYGLDFENLEKSDFLIRWHPDGTKLTQSLSTPVNSKTKRSSLFSKKNGVNGQRLEFKDNGVMQPIEDWFAEAKIDEYYDRLGGVEMIEAKMDSVDVPVHRLGGYPSFTQQDPRSVGKYSEYNRVLLHIGCDDFVMFGDGGKCTFFITEEDLKARNFKQVLYYWDCS